MTTYLVTGATGFVGSALTQRLLAQARAQQPGAASTSQVHVLVRNATQAQSWAASGAQAHVASLGDPNAIAQAADGVEVLFHCAGESSHRASAQALSWINVAGTENVVNAARHAGVRRVVHLSCADATLANRDRLNWKETQTLMGPALDACARSKLLAEELALGSSDRSLQVTALRPVWIWGPGERHVLPALCAEALRGRLSLCGDGENLLPALYIDNLLDALLLASDAANAPGHAYHVVDGDVWTARELLAQLCEALGLPAPRRGIYALSYALAAVREKLGAPGLWRSDVVHRGRSCLFDGLGAARDLGYTPKIDTAEGLRRLKAWATQVGGPAAIARTARVPASAQDAEALMHAAHTSDSA
jgi:2-alkyl-3-oxoalkanoate reductase